MVENLLTRVRPGAAAVALIASAAFLAGCETMNETFGTADANPNANSNASADANGDHQQTVVTGQDSGTDDGNVITDRAQQAGDKVEGRIDAAGQRADDRAESKLDRALDEADQQFDRALDRIFD